MGGCVPPITPLRGAPLLSGAPRVLIGTGNGAAGMVRSLRERWPMTGRWAGLRCGLDHMGRKVVPPWRWCLFIRPRWATLTIVSSLDANPPERAGCRLGEVRMPKEWSVEHVREWGTDRANKVTIVLQKILGSLIAICILARIATWFFPGLFHWLPARNSLIDNFFSQPVLDIVAGGLGVSAGFDLAFMLFTPGPDEAFAPLIKGVAATILLMASDDKTLGLRKAAAMVLLTAIIMALYVFCRHFEMLGERKEREPPQTDNSKGVPENPTAASNASSTSGRQGNGENE